MSAGNKLNLLRSQGGGVMIFGLGIVILFIFFLALTVDLPRIELSGLELQRASEASALACALEFNTKLSGWRNAKRAAFVPLRLNRIYGDSGAVSSGFGILSGTVDLWETTGSYSVTAYTVGNLKIEIDRGIYAVSGGNGVFSSLEGLEYTNRTTSSGIESMPGFEAANSCRVQITLLTLGTPFAGFFTSKARAVVKKAIASREDF